MYSDLSAASCSCTSTKYNVDVALQIIVNSQVTTLTVVEKSYHSLVISL